jgi:RNA polymerase sigma factor (sigma-70 family)
MESVPAGQDALAYTLDEAELARLKARDARAQARFFRAQRARVEGLCARVLGQGADAQEIATDVLGDFLFRYVDGVESPRAVSTYLKLMATRRSLRWVKNRGRNDEVQDDGAAGAALDPAGARALEPAVDQAIWARQMMPRLDGCLEQLTPKAREVLKLRFSTELTNEAIGDIVGGSKQYIGRLIKESSDKLRTCLEG